MLLSVPARIRTMTRGAAVAAVVVAAGISLFQISVLAKSFRLEHVDVQATLARDGSLEITESRRYRFSGRYSWADYRLPLQKVGTVVDFSLSEGGRIYRQDTTEDPGTYLINSRPDEFYVKWFYRARNESRTFTLHYRVTEVTVRYADVAELYFQFVGEANQNEIGDVSVQLQLPEAASSGPVRAWAHGPLHGQVEFVNGRLLYHVSPLPARRFWEARVLFPAEWLAETVATRSGSALDRILAEEKRWAEEANLARQRAQEAMVQRVEDQARAQDIALVLCGVLLIGFAMLYFRFGRGYSVPTTAAGDPSIPSDQHPALAGFLFANKQAGGTVLAAALFDLARRGIVTVHDEGTERRWWQSHRFVLELEPHEFERQRDSLLDFERSLIRFLFDDLADGGLRLDTQQLRKNRSKMTRWFRRWKKLLEGHVSEEKLFDSSSWTGVVVSVLLSVLIAVGGIIVLLRLGEAGILAIVAGAAGIGLSFALLRYTPEMKKKRARWRAIKDYLKKYDFLHRSGELDARQVNQYLVWALALGAGSKAIEKLFETIPSEDRAAFVPWYSSHSLRPFAPAEFASNVSSLVTAATSTVSSSAGAGGGASGGGGGGGGGASGGAG